MGHVLPGEEPSDCWRLVGEDDPTTPPTVSRMLNHAGSRAEWRRAGLPVLFDDAGEPRPVQRAGRLYGFERVEPGEVARFARPAPPEPHVDGDGATTHAG